MKNFKNHKVLYSAAVLTDKSHAELLQRFYIPKDWKTYAHHMTIIFGKSLESVGMENLKDTNVTLLVTHIGKTDKVMSVRVEGCYTTNDIPHITLAVNINDGGKPVMSNDIKEWEEIEHFEIDATITEIKK